MFLSGVLSRVDLHAGELLGDQALILPAHGAGWACGGNISDRDDTTLRIEKATNPVFKKSRKEFVNLKLKEKLPRPPYFKHMEQVNLEGGRPLKSASGHRVLQPKEFQKRIREGVLSIPAHPRPLPARTSTAPTTSGWKACRRLAAGSPMPRPGSSS